MLIQKKYANQNTEAADDITVDKEGNISILSNVQLPPNNQGTVTLTKLAPTLESVIERRTYEYSEQMEPFSLKILSDGGYLVTA